MLSRVVTYVVDGVESLGVAVETDVRTTGLPAFTVVGLPDKAVREARDRVKSALTNCGFVFPGGRVTVNLAPAHVRKAGAGFDLPIALGLLVATEQLGAECLEGTAVAGELSLAGEVAPIRGALAIAEGARRHGLTRLLVPRSRAREAALVDGLAVVGVESLVEAVGVLRGDAQPAPLPPVVAGARAVPEPDFADVRGHEALMPAIEAAAAGGHNLFLHGPPGTGKTMIARRLPGILPPLDRAEAVEITRIHSVMGLHGDGGLVTRRPFRAPHHTISPSGLVGGGSADPAPGEVTLAHRGVLFLDELSEFPRHALEALRQPLEDGHVMIVRGQRARVFPTRCMLVAASNPCPCGLTGSACRCSATEVRRHEQRMSGPLMDRIDISLAVDRPPAEAMRRAPAYDSASLRERVVAARERQVARFAGTPVRCNAQMPPRLAAERAGLTHAAREALLALHDRDALSARGYTRVLRVARTIADLAGSDEVTPDHVEAAAGHRTTTPPATVAA